MDQNTKVQIIKWVENMLHQKYTKQIGKSKGFYGEVEAKIGTFMGKNSYSVTYLKSLDDQVSILDKSSCQYEFKSRINDNQIKMAQQYLKKLMIDNQDHYFQETRVDFNFQKKNQRASLLADNRAMLIEKKKDSTQHLDVTNCGQQYRFSLSYEKILSESVKDIIKQLSQRSTDMNFIRVKESQKIILEDFEYCLATVYSISKYNKCFKNILELIQNISSINESINQIFDVVKKSSIDPDYEFEIELVKKEHIEDQVMIQKIAENFIERIETSITSIQEIPKLIKKNSQEFNEIKKIKLS